MKKTFTISEQEKSAILKKYYILKESNTRNCVEGNCKDGKGKLVVVMQSSDIKITKTYDGTFKNGKITNGIFTLEGGDFKVTQTGNFDSLEELTGEADYVKEITGKNFKQVTKGTFESSFLTKGETKVDINDLSFTIKSDDVEKNTYKDAEIRFNDGSIYYGNISIDDTIFKFQSTIKKLESDDFVQFHIDTEGHQSDTERTTVGTPTSKSSLISDDLRDQWEGCESTPNDLFVFNKPEDDYVNELPELGYFKFDGSIDGKNIKVNACFDKFKLIKTYDENETGDRGTFNGTYYTDDEDEPLTFQGDESKANKFKNGTLTDSPEYNFYSSKFEYTGSFIDGLMSQGKIIFDDKSFYEGEFKNGKIEGKGKFTFPNKSFFEGEFKQYVKDDGTITYKVTMENGGIIDDLIDYLKKLKLNYFSNNEDLSFGVLKGAKVEGVVQYKSIMTFPVDANQKEEKTFEGVLPKSKVVFKSESVKVETEKIKGKTFEATTDDNGKFLLENIPYGKYSIKITFGGKLNPLFKYENKNLNINSDKKYKFSATKTEKLEKLESEITGDDISNENYNEQIIQPLLKSNKVNDNFIADLIDGTFLNKYGKTNALKTCLNQFKNYTDELKQLYFGKIEKTLLKPEEDLKLTKQSLQYCWNQFKPQISQRIKKDDISLIQQPGGKLLAYQVDLKENYNKTNIYNKGNDMNETIKNIIKEHAKMKKVQTSAESKIIENRLNFIFEDRTEYTTRNKIRKNLLSEKNQLLYMGYTPKLVNEIFNRFMVKI